MGREIKRVPLDFDWPLNKRWEGYVNAHYAECVTCSGQGVGIRAQRLDEFMRNLCSAGRESSVRPDNYVSPPIKQVDDELNQHAFIMVKLSGGGIDRYERILEENKLPYWPWPHLDPVETLLAAADLPADWGGPLEREIIYRLAKLTPPEHQYDCHHATRNRATGELTLLEQKRVFYPGQPIDHSKDPVENFPSPILGELGIHDPGTRMHELVHALGFEPDIFGSTYWRPTMEMFSRIFRYLGWKPDEISEYGTEYYHWDRCGDCDGRGIPVANQEACDAWEESDPPEGDGWQVWETVTEGSPITPVFATGDELIEHLVTLGDGSSRTYSREGATAFVKGAGWAPSGVITGGKMYSGIDACALMDNGSDE